MTTTGQLFIVSAPSGAGKTSLVRALCETDRQISVSVSHTTRPMRPGETDGVHYHFVDHMQFEAMIAAQGFLEYARVFDHYYGTARAEVEMQLARGHDVILEIDWQGARQVRVIKPDSLSIFILPPSRAALEARLMERGQDNQAVITRRMAAAVAEMSHWDEYDYVLVNDHFATALGDLHCVVRTARLQYVRQAQALTPILKLLLGDMHQTG